MEQPIKKERNVPQIVRFLTNMFDQATSHLERAARTEKTGANELYLLQREFAYRLNEVMQGPECVIQKNIAACNDFIDHVMVQAKRDAAR